MIQFGYFQSTEPAQSICKPILSRIEFGLLFDYILYWEVGVPPADLHIHDNQLARTTKMDGIPIRADVLFTNDKGEETVRIQKRTAKTLQNLPPVFHLRTLPT